MVEILARPTFRLGIGAWSDIAIASGWHLQRHAVDGHCRLLAPTGFVVAKGGYEPLLDRWRASVPQDAPDRDRVLLLHGLTRTGRIYRRLGRALEAEGFEVIAPTYASTRQGLDAHLRDIRHLLDHLPGSGRMALVGHSLGGLVVHRLLVGPGVWKQRHRPSAVVLITVPHGGSRLGAGVARYRVAASLLGPSLEDCLPQTRRHAFPIRLPCLNILGGTGRRHGFNPWLSGDNDAILAEDEMRIDGASEERRIASPHGLIFRHGATIGAIRSFLGSPRRDAPLAGDDHDVRAA